MGNTEDVAVAHDIQEMEELRRNAAETPTTDDGSKCENRRAFTKSPKSGDKKRLSCG